MGPKNKHVGVGLGFFGELFINFHYYSVELYSFVHLHYIF